MKTSDFFYNLPPELIAQTPSSKRDESRLMVLSKTGKIKHEVFRNLPLYINSGDCLVLNNTKVIPARLIGERENGGFAELLLLNDLGENTWECLARPGKRIKPGCILNFGNGKLEGKVIKDGENGLKEINFDYEGIFLEVLEELGRIPLPPYIKEYSEDLSRYQTVYAKNPGSAAAPTAGLHFTPELIEKLKSAGVNVCELTLHIGLGTFRPVQTEDIESHVMHSERFFLPKETAYIINKTKKDGKRIISVGTTVTRTLEAMAGDDSFGSHGEKETNIFITPGYKFKVVDSLITNFHLPESTLIMLVSALAGHGNIMQAYSEAVREKYRFFSFGDAMLIL